MEKWDKKKDRQIYKKNSNLETYSWNTEARSNKGTPEFKMFEEF